MKKIIVDPKVDANIRGAYSGTTGRALPKILTAGIATRLFPNVSNTDVSLDSVRRRGVTTPTVTVNQSMGPVDAAYQKTFYPEGPDVSEFTAAAKIPVGDARLTGTFNRQNIEGLGDTKDYHVGATVPVRGANLTGGVSRFPARGSETLNLGLSDINLADGKLEFRAEKTYNSTGDNPTRVGASWRKQVGPGEIEIQTSVSDSMNRRVPQGSIAYNEGPFKIMAGQRGNREAEKYVHLGFNYPLARIGKLLRRNR